MQAPPQPPDQALSKEQVSQWLSSLSEQGKAAAELSLAGRQIDDAAFGPLATLLLQRGFPQLQALDLSRNRLTDRGCVLLAECAAALRSRAIGGLRRLQLAFNQIGADGAEALAMSFFAPSGDYTLDLSDNPLGDGGVIAVATALRIRGCEASLQLRSTGCSEEGCAALVDALASCAALDLSSNALHETSLEHLVRGLTPRLRHLGLSNVVPETPVTPRPLALALAAGLKHTQLRSLNLAGAVLQDAGLRPLVESLAPALVEADLAGNRLRDGNLLAQLLAGGGVVSLGLEGNELGDLAVLAFAAGAALNPRLQRLNLARNHFGDAGAVALAQTPLPALRELDLTSNTMGDEAARSLMRLPKLVQLGLRGTTVSAGCMAQLEAEMIARTRPAVTAPEPARTEAILERARKALQSASARPKPQQQQTVLPAGPAGPPQPLVAEKMETAQLLASVKMDAPQPLVSARTEAEAVVNRARQALQHALQKAPDSELLGVPALPVELIQAHAQQPLAPVFSTDATTIVTEAPVQQPLAPVVSTDATTIVTEDKISKGVSNHAPSPVAPAAELAVPGTQPPPMPGKPAAAGAPPAGAACTAIGYPLDPRHAGPPPVPPIHLPANPWAHTAAPAPPVPPTGKGVAPPPPKAPSSSKGKGAPPAPKAAKAKPPPVKAKSVASSEAPRPEAGNEAPFHRKLYWKPLDIDAEGTLFEDCESALVTPRLDVDALTRLFEGDRDKSARLARHSSSLLSRVQLRSAGMKLLSDHRARNMAIVLKRLPLSTKELTRILQRLTWEATTLSTDDLEQILEVIPTKEEAEKLREYSSPEARTLLRDVEQMILPLALLSRGTARVRLLCIARGSRQRFGATARTLASIRGACQALQRSQMLKEVMLLALELGNYINHGDSTKGARAVAVGSLMALRDFRTGRMSSLHFLCASMLRARPDRDAAEVLARELRPALVMSKLQVQTLSSALRGTLRDLEVVTSECRNHLQEYEAADDEPDEPLEAELEDYEASVALEEEDATRFVEDVMKIRGCASRRLQRMRRVVEKLARLLRADMERTAEQAQAALKFCGVVTPRGREVPVEFEVLLQQLAEFSRVFRRHWDEVRDDLPSYRQLFGDETAGVGAGVGQSEPR